MFGFIDASQLDVLRLQQKVPQLPTDVYANMLAGFDLSGKQFPLSVAMPDPDRHEFNHKS